ncbi:hypothetical protein PAXINDRAFT_17530 [Paxillus involutus ATCC 200175]|uniref:Uncharacterized protein n=1 Tax=Paxillus involutus ATCC 200175 TaxID=664439 RepID=A0A0C9TEI7_PAXIN|nr:hypothetical protein PAXINDRAFT_17530 [Paxillus involutus ATCC 200175]
MPTSAIYVEKRKQWSSILLECEKSVAITTIWQLSKELLRKREILTWSAIKFGTIMGSQLMVFRNDRIKKIDGKIRRFATLRNERLSLKDGIFHSTTEIHNRWVAAIKTRLKIDRLKLSANPAKYGKKATKPELDLDVLWDGTDIRHVFSPSDTYW